MTNATGKTRVLLGLVAMGAGAILGQLLLVRELLVIFSGNELAAGIALGAWLFWTGLGSSLWGRFADALGGRPSVFAGALFFLAVLLPANLLAVRGLRVVFETPAGEILSFPSMIVGTFVILAPFCVVAGFLFALGCSLYAARVGSNPRVIGVVYACEAIGGIIGGVGFSYFLIPVVNQWQIGLIGGVVLCIGTLLLWPRLRPITVVASCILLAAAVFTAEEGNLISRGWTWHGYDLKTSVDSVYGNISVVGGNSQLSVFENGILSFTYPDPLTAEEAVHFPLLEHPSPHSVLVIGGGVGGLLEQILKHPSVRRIDYVELDPSLVTTSRRYLPDSATRPLSDPRVHVVYTDGRRFVQRAAERYDVVIMHLPDPATAQINRCYTREFFAEVARVLATGGLFHFSVNSSENVIGSTLARFLTSIRRTMAEVFSEVLILPGDSAKFFGAKAPEVLTSDARLLMARAGRRGLNLAYMRDYYLTSKLSPGRIAYVQTMASQEGVHINRDLRPICYFYTIVLWSAQYAPWSQTWFEHIGKIRGSWLMGGVVVITLLFLFWGGSRGALRWGVGVIGFSGIALEIIVLIAFQVFFGYVYYKLGIIITAYMVGLAIGGWMMVILSPDLRHPVGVLSAVQASMAVVAIGTVLAMVALQQGWATGSVTTAIEVFFPAFTFAAGFVGGLHFPLAATLYFRDTSGVGKVGGLLYGIDLYGSSLGALVVSVLMIPLLGMLEAAYVVVCMNVSAAALLAVRA